MGFISNFFGPNVPGIDASEAKRRLAQPQSAVLLDVRQPEEFRQGRIAGAQLIPLGELRNRVGELPANRQIIVMCHSGNRSLAATDFLRSEGLDAINLAGGIQSWARAGLPIETNLSERVK